MPRVPASLKVFFGLILIAVFAFFFFSIKASEAKGLVSTLHGEAKAGVSFIEVIELHPDVRSVRIRDANGKVCASVSAAGRKWRVSLPKTAEEAARSQDFPSLPEALGSQATLLPTCPSLDLLFSRIAVFNVSLKAEVDPRWILTKDAQVSASN